MSMSFCSFASGSSGNCYMVKTEETGLLIDAGISGKRIWSGLEETDTPKELLSALLITHEHADHIKSVSVVTKKHGNLSVFATEGTWENMEVKVPRENRYVLKKDSSFMIGDITVKPFAISHDAADPVGYSFYSKGKQISIVTDTGYLPETIMEEVCDADLLVLEANHDEDMLKIGRYPWFLKQRVLGEQGHLSNETAGKGIVSLLQRNGKERQVLLAHLSRENNFPEMAYQTVKNILEEADYYIGKNVYVDLLERECASGLYQV